MRCPSPAIHRAARNAAAIDSGFALYASLTIRTPSGVVNVSMRHRDTTASDSASAAAASDTPSVTPVAADASAFETMCSPGTASVTGTRSDATPT